MTKVVKINMMTEWIKIKDEELESVQAERTLQKAGEIIKSGGLVAFPTETVYGLGGDAFNAKSSYKIYEAKGRPSDNPLIIHIAAYEDLEKIVKTVPENAKILAKQFWPGPLTMIFEKSGHVPKETTGGLNTAAVRFPNHPLALRFIQAAGGFVAAPSANLSGRPSPTCGGHVYQDLNGRIDMILDDGGTSIGLESTIVDMTEEIPVILRPGAITAEMLEAVLGSVSQDQTILSIADGQKPKAPGMKYKHYAPKGELTIIIGTADRVSSYINEQIKEKQQSGYKVGVIAVEETMASYLPCVRKSVGKRQDAASAARSLYRILREFDEEAVDFIYAEGFETSGIGHAIMNRLLKAAGHRVIEV